MIEKVITAEVRGFCNHLHEATHMSCSNFGGSHHIAVVVQHVDALGQLRVSHQAHVADVCCGFKEKNKQFHTSS